MKLSQTQNNTKFKLLQVGESGNGKTTRALTAAQYGPVFFYDFDDKLTQLAPKVDADTKSKVEFETFKEYKDAEKHLLELLASFKSGQRPYATVVVDTWSRLHDIEIEHHKKLNPRVKKFSFDDWGVIKGMNREFVSMLLQLPCNLIVNCHVGKRMDAQDNQVLTVGTTGSFGQELPQYFQETHYLYYEMGRFKAKCTKTSKIVANTGLPVDLYDDKGVFKSNSLDIFKQTAYRVGV
jgi:hypothetical protein